jgi:diguanylate cyclase (GGDEF)-like protein
LRAELAARETTAKLDVGELDFLIDVSEMGQSGPQALRVLLERCIKTLDCEAAAFVSPERDLTVIVQRDVAAPEANAEVVDRTRRNLLAWAQLNDRPMVVNRVGETAGAAPYKILSCPVRSDPNELTGLIALFRPSTGQNFERRDVHLLEFLCRRAVSLLAVGNDTLTGLATRQMFEADIAEITAVNSRGAGGTAASLVSEPFTGAMLQINIDRLQAVNDTFGLDAGDAVLREIADCIRPIVSGTGFASRLSGDRFGIYLPDADGASGCRLAQQLLDAVAAHTVKFGGDEIPLSVSIGVAARQRGLASAAELFAATGASATEARRQGGSRFALYRPGAARSPLEARELAAAARLRGALTASQFVLLAQPIVPFAAADKAAGYEVLIRLPDEKGILLAPDQFLSVARRCGLALGVDTWVFSELLRRLEAHGDVLAELPVGIAVNVSEQSMLSPNYVNTVVAGIARSTLPGSAFSFEIAEAAAVGNLDAAEAFIEIIRGTGARVALDKFGSGLTSFAQLRRLQVDYLKIGGDLVRGMVDDRHLESMVYGLAKAAESLEMPTVAEQVENEAVAAKLQAMGFVYGQGFAFGRPAALNDLLADGSARIAL